MRVGSLFSGIGGLDYGLHRAGLRHVFFCESEPFRRDVLRARWPGVPIYDDVRDVGRGVQSVGERGDEPDAAGGIEHRSERGAVDLLCGGFPCQDLSVAGQRRGLAGERSGLFHEFARIAESLRPRWLLVENVPGLLSSNGGRDFGVVVGTLADLGYGVAWRVLDSRFFGVPQRRRRVFIVGALADGDPAAAADRAGQVLAVGSRCPRHPATRGEAREDAADASSVGFALRRDPGGVGQGHNTNYVASLSGLGDGGPDDNDGQANRVIVANTMKSQRGNGGGGIGPEETLVAAPLTKGSASGDGVNQPGRRQEDDVNIVAFHPTGGGAKGLSPTDDLAPGTGTGASGTVAIAEGGWGSGVRRLTPT